MTQPIHPSKQLFDPSKQLFDLLERARELAPELRARWLDEACADAPELRAELDALLAYDDGQPLLHATAALKTVAYLLTEDDLTDEEIGQYRIIKPIGAGGMGRVYLAEDQKLERQVALKFLPESFTAEPGTTEPERVRRFAQEARAASALNHPNIITVYETGQHERRHYIAYELVAGQTLRARLLGEPLRWQEAVVIGAQIAAALKAAHAAGIIHRDIKPENVMLRADGLVKVLDFGIAKRLELREAESSSTGGGEGATAAASATLAGQVFGTLGYLAPEQARGEKLDARADVFALGMVLYEMLAGRHPWAELSAAEKLEAVQSADELPPLMVERQDLPAALVALVTNAVKKDRAQRSQAISPMLDVLNELKPTNVEQTDKDLQGAEASLRTQNANRLLNQFVSLYAANRRTRLSPTAMWTIWRHSNLKRGKLEKRLLRQSLFSTLRKGAAVACLAGLVTLGVMAWNSVEERWDGRPLREGHSKAAMRAVFSHDGSRLATYGADERIIIWDFLQRRQITTIATKAENKYALDFSPDGRWFAHSDGNTVVIREANDPQKIVTLLHSYQARVEAIGFSPDSKLLASGVNGEKTVIWAVDGWQKLSELPGYICHSKILFYADSRRLLTANGIWDVRSGERAATGRFCPMAIAPDNHLTVSIENTGNTIFFDLLHRRQIKSERAHQFFGRSVAFSHDGRLAVTGAEDIALWDTATLRVIAHFEHSDNVWDLLFSPDDRWLVSTHGDGSILVWDMQRRKRVADLAGHSDKVVSVAFSPSGNRIASASADQSVNLWNAKSGLKEIALTGYPTALDHVWFLNEDTILASDFDNNFSWHAIIPQQNPVPSLPFFADGTLVISPDKRWVIHGVTVYDWQAQRVAFDFSPMVGGTSEYAFSPDGRLLALTAHSMGKLFLCEVGTWRVIEQLRLPDLKPIRLAFTPDSKRLITGCMNGEVALWETRPLRLKQVLGKHTDHVQAIAVSPDGTQAVSASDDRTIAWWGLAHGRLIYKHAQTAPILGVAFSPNGRQVVTGGQDKSVRVYTRQRSLWGWQLD